jgi:hypothetical protein
MSLVAVLLFASACVGLMVGPRYNVYMLIPASLIVALVSATVTRLHDIGFWESSAITFACITATQVAYLVVTLLHLDVPLTSDPSDDHVRNDRQTDVSDEKDQRHPPSYLAE